MLSRLIGAGVLAGVVGFGGPDCLGQAERFENLVDGEGGDGMGVRKDTLV